jgi:hypothetical protein
VSLKKKFERILARERSLANSVARSVIIPKPLGVWDFMIPVIFILNFMKNKQVKELFIQNFMFTKKLALQAAFDMVKSKRSKEEVMVQVEEKTNDVLASEETRGIYSNEIRREQIKEIDLLIDHYCKLFETEGEDYSTLVANAYRSRSSYTAFVEQLKSTEKAVSKAAQQTLGDKTDTVALFRIEQATARIRMAEIEKTFRI